MTRKEKDFLLKRKCRVLLVYNGKERKQPHLTGSDAYDHGRKSVEEACRLANAIGIHGNARIYGDVESWPTDVDWFVGWCEIMGRSPYAGLGGIYGNARGKGKSTSAWASNAAAGAKSEVAFSGLEKLASAIVGGWWTPGSVTKPLDLHLWSNKPNYHHHTPLPAKTKIVPHSFHPAPPPLPKSPYNNVVVWQYRLDASGVTGGRIDLDLSTEDGFRGRAM